MINLNNIFAFQQLDKLDESKEDDKRLMDYLAKGIAEDDLFDIDNDLAQEEAQEWFNLYKKLKQANRLPADFKDQYKMMKTYSANEIIDKLKILRDSSSRSQQKKQDKNKGAKKAYEDDTWIIYEILNYAAAKYYGKGTKWCISGNYEGEEERGEHWFNDYINNEYDHYYFTFNKETGEKWAICTRDGDVSDVWTADDHKVFKVPGLPPIPGIYSEESIKFDVKDGVLVKALFSRDDQDLIKEIDLNVVAQEFGPITEIGKGAFQYCKKLVTVILPSTCTKIGEDAFRESSIKQIIMREVNIIGARAFADCWQLHRVALNPGVKIIPNYCFYGCPLSSISLGSVEKIGVKALTLETKGLFFSIPEQVKEIDAEFISSIEHRVAFIFDGAPVITGTMPFLPDESFDGVSIIINDVNFIVKNFPRFFALRDKRLVVNGNLEEALGKDKYKALMAEYKRQNLDYIERY